MKIVADTIWFHGSGYNSDSGVGSEILHRPTTSRPLYITKFPYFAETHMSERYGKFFIFKIKEGLNAFDLGSAEDLSRIGFIPGCLKKQLVDKKLELWSALQQIQPILKTMPLMFAKTRGEEGVESARDAAGVSWSEEQLISVYCEAAGGKENTPLEEIKKYYGIEDQLYGDYSEAVEWFKTFPRDFLDRMVKDYWFRHESFCKGKEERYDIASFMYEKIEDAGYDAVYMLEESKYETLALFDIGEIEWVYSRPLTRKDFNKLVRKWKIADYADDREINAREIPNTLKERKLVNNDTMKRNYTKQQIQEAISYWRKQLAEGNYRRVNESSDENETPADRASRALDAAGFYVEYIDDNTIQLSFDDKYDYYSNVDKIANALYSVGLTEYYIDRPEDEDDPNANWVCPVRFEA